MLSLDSVPHAKTAWIARRLTREERGAGRGERSKVQDGTEGKAEVSNERIRVVGQFIYSWWVGARLA